MKKKLGILALSVLLAMVAPLVARAHDGHKHSTFGTIEAVQGVHLQLKQTDGKTITLMLDKETTITRGKEKLDAKALKAGERAAVDYSDTGAMLMAHAIRLGAKK
jgi:hypothetical protein